MRFEGWKQDRSHICNDFKHHFIMTVGFDSLSFSRVRLIYKTERDNIGQDKTVLERVFYIRK
jgi:hypothetical protein